MKKIKAWELSKKPFMTSVCCWFRKELKLNNLNISILGILLFEVRCCKTEKRLGALIQQSNSVYVFYISLKHFTPISNSFFHACSRVFILFILFSVTYSSPLSLSLSLSLSLTHTYFFSFTKTRSRTHTHTHFLATLSNSPYTSHYKT